MTTKALVREINYGDKFSFWGLLMPDGSYGISVTQANGVLKFSALQKTAARNLKRLHGGDFPVSKVLTELNSNKANVLTLEQFEKLALMLAFDGNKIAQEFVELNTGGFLRQRFADAFGERFEVEERDAWVKARLEGKVVRNRFTDAVKDYYVFHEDYDAKPEKTRQRFAAITNRTKQVLGFPLTIGHRDIASSDQLKEYEMAERCISRWITKHDIEPMEAINKFEREFM